MKVINLLGGPGTGKSTTSASVFSALKKMGEKCELVTEFAKYLTYQESFKVLSDQLFVFSTQHHKIWNIKDTVDYIVTDSPLLLSLVYFNPDNGVYEKSSFDKLVIDTINSYDNINIFLKRNIEEHPYQEYGRTQTLDQAIDIDNHIKFILNEFNVKYIEVEMIGDYESKIIDIIINGGLK